MSDEDCHFENTVDMGLGDYADTLIDQQSAVRCMKKHKDDGRASKMPYLQGWIDALAFAMEKYGDIRGQIESVENHHDCSCAEDDSSSNSQNEEV